MYKLMSKASRAIGFAMAILLSACASQYEAPIDDRSDTLQRQTPVIVNNGESVDATLRRQRAAIESSQTGSRSSSQSASNTASATAVAVASTAANNQVNNPVGASSTVVRAVNLGGGISRNTTRSSPSPASLEDEESDVSIPAPVSRQPMPQQPAVSTSPAQRSTGAQASGQLSEPVTTPAQPAVTQQSSAVAGTASSTGTQHRVSRGDTLYSIAWRHNMDVRSLALVNDLSEPYTIYPGQVLQIENSTLSNESLESVADIPVSPAGEEISTGQRPQAAIDGRRIGSVNERDVEGVTWQWPSDGRLLSMFNTSGTARGIDIAGTQGDSVYASAEGDVVYAGTGIQGAGNLVILRHSDRHLSAYMHNSRLLVSEGDFVRGGDKIAEVGNGPDGRDLLHFEVRLDGKPVNPVRYLPNR